MKANIIRGHVIDEFGKPVTGAFVSICESTSMAPDIASITAQDGTFKLLLPTGDFSLVAYTKSGKTGLKKISKYNHYKSTPTICVHN